MDDVSDAARDAVRAAMEDRALYLLFIERELRKEGVRDAHGLLSRAVLEYGRYKAGGRVFKTPGEFLSVITAPLSRAVMEGEVVEASGERAVVKERYCPLYQAWKKAGCSAEEIESLCGIAEGVDIGLTEGSPLEVEFGGDMATAGGYCQMTISRTPTKNT